MTGATVARMQIRPAVPADSGAVFAMTAALSLEAGPQRAAFEEQFARVLGDTRSAVFDVGD